ncbi:MAG: hypothetical protein AAFU60_12695 [Bacteroidota bacterium]
MAKLSRKKIQSLSKILPNKERTVLLEESWTISSLEKKIEETQMVMKRDVQIGIPLLLSYAISLVFFQQQWALITLTVIAIIYYTYTTFTTGTYGLNRRRLKVYKAMLAELQGS